MKKTLITLAASLAAVTTAFADTHPIPSVQLHAKPSAQSKAATKPIAVNEPLVVIMYSPDKQWAKVANRKDGSVGWINKKEFKKAVKTYRKPDFQSVIVSTDRSNGKTTQTVVAFRNGKPLTTAEAQALYGKLKNQYQQQRKSFREQQRAMRQMERDFFRNEAGFMNSFFTQPPFPHHHGPKMMRGNGPWAGE
jgi:hypothetical protein